MKKGAYRDEQIFGEDLVFFRNTEGKGKSYTRLLILINIRNYNPDLLVSEIETSLNRNFQISSRESFRAINVNLKANITHQYFVVSAFDAYCPHLGAKLTKGGQIAKDDCLVCPFHGWEFETDFGRCVKIPDIEDSCIPRNGTDLETPKIMGSRYLPLLFVKPS